MKKSGLLQQRSDYAEAVRICATHITRQFDLDTMQLTLNLEYGWGYDRIMDFTHKWKALQAEYQDAIQPRKAEADVAQERIERHMRRITKNKGEYVPWEERYNGYLLPISYEGRGGHNH